MVVAPYVKSFILPLLSFSSVSHIPYSVNFRFNNWLNMSWALACFLPQFVTLEAWSCLKNDIDTVNLVSHWYQLDCILVRSIIFRITSTSGLIMGQICRRFLHAFSVNSGVIIRKLFCKSILCFVYERCVKYFLDINKLRTVLTFLYCVS